MHTGNNVNKGGNTVRRTITVIHIIIFLNRKEDKRDDDKELNTIMYMVAMFIAFIILLYIYLNIFELFNQTNALCGNVL